MGARIYIALPVLNELEYISGCINSIAKQTYRNFELWVCVNQPDEWNHDQSKYEIIENNRQVIKKLQSIKDFAVKTIDRSSPGNGWEHKKGCVGWARKVIMDAINIVAEKDDII